MSSLKSVKHWDDECDVLICGYGCAGASAAIEAALSIEAARQGVILPTVNHIQDPELDDVDVVPNQARRQRYEFFLSNAFGFGGTNCCIIFKGV